MDVPGVSQLVVIGRGGSATVYRGVQEAFAREVAVKVMERLVSDPAQRAEFERECRAIGALSAERSIVTVYDAGITPDGHPYLVMEYLPSSLGDLLGKVGRLPWRDAVGYGLEVAQALQAAHDAGVLHRDVKPENVLLTDAGEPRLADFGLARIAGGYESRSTTVRASLTHAAPEVIDGHRATVATDVYSLGSTLHHLMSGTPPFIAEGDESVIPVMRRILTEEPPSLEPFGVPGSVEEVLRRAMAKDPADRQQSARQLAAELEAAAAAPSEPGRVVRGANLTMPVAGARRRAVEQAGDEAGTAPRRRRRLVVAAAAAVVLLGSGAAFAVAARDRNDAGTSASATTSTTSQPQATVTVPRLIGLPFEDGEAILEGLDVRLVRSGAVFSDQAPAGEIVSQDPEPGEEVDAGGVIRVVVSKGPEAVVLPDLTGSDAAQAAELLREAGLAVGAVIGDPAQAFFMATVGGVPVAPGQPIAPGTTVDLVFGTFVPPVEGPEGPAPQPSASSPRPGSQSPVESQSDTTTTTTTTTTSTTTTTTTTIPAGSVQLVDFAGWYREDAKAWIISRGLIYGQRVTGRAPAGTQDYAVVGQTPGPGAVVPEGTRVWITSYDPAYCTANPGDCV